MTANTLVTSFSEFDTLTQCERKWGYRYAEGAEEEGFSPGLSFGIGWHRFTNAWWGRELVEERGIADRVVHSVSSELREAYPDHEQQIDELVTKLVWLALRYVDHYGIEPPADWNVLDVEHTFDRVALGGALLRGRIDALVEIDGDLWVVEDKTYSSRQRLDLVNVSWQETIYAMAAEKIYRRPVFGVLFNGAYTYRWKKDDRPTEESFDRVFLDRSAAQRVQAIEQLQAFLYRRSELNGGRTALANLGPLCNGCGYKQRCFSELKLGDEEIVLEDDDDE